MMSREVMNRKERKFTDFSRNENKVGDKNGFRHLTPNQMPAIWTLAVVWHVMRLRVMPIFRW